MTIWQFIIENWYALISIILALGGLAFAWRNASKTTKTKLTNAIYTKIPSLVRQANVLFGKGNGIAKFNYVLTELKSYAIELGTKVDIGDLTERIEDEVKTLNCERDEHSTKNVNPISNNEVINSVKVDTNIVENNNVDL